MSHKQQKIDRAGIELLAVLKAPVLSKQAYEKLLRNTSKGVNHTFGYVLKALKYIGIQLLLVVAGFTLAVVLVVIMHIISGN